MVRSPPVQSQDYACPKRFEDQCGITEFPEPGTPVSWLFWALVPTLNYTNIRNAEQSLPWNIRLVAQREAAPPLKSTSYLMNVFSKQCWEPPRWSSVYQAWVNAKSMKTQALPLGAHDGQMGDTPPHTAQRPQHPGCSGKLSFCVHLNSLPGGRVETRPSFTHYGLLTVMSSNTEAVGSFLSLLPIFIPSTEPSVRRHLHKHWGPNNLKGPFQYLAPQIL